MPNAWVLHVKKMAQELGITYGCAMSMKEVKDSYKKKGVKKIIGKDEKQRILESLAEGIPKLTGQFEKTIEDLKKPMKKPISKESFQKLGELLKKKKDQKENQKYDKLRDDILELFEQRKPKKKILLGSEEYELDQERKRQIDEKLKELVLSKEYKDAENKYKELEKEHRKLKYVHPDIIEDWVKEQIKEYYKINPPRISLNKALKDDIKQYLIQNYKKAWEDLRKIKDTKKDLIKYIEEKHPELVTIGIYDFKNENAINKDKLRRDILDKEIEEDTEMGNLLRISRVRYEDYSRLRRENPAIYQIFETGVGDIPRTLRELTGYNKYSGKGKKYRKM